jgi:halimadienyl-diphosphate synthase
MIYEPGTSVAFSLEFLGAQGDPERLCRLLASSGAIACSPATTAYLLHKVGQSQPALQYLESMRAMPGGVPHFYPFSIFEIAWVLEHLSFAGVPLDDSKLMSSPIWDTLEAALGPDGACMDPGFGIKDGDTTAVVMHVLALSGRAVNPMSLHHFEDPEMRIFRTFEFERNASVSTNAHALETLALLPVYPDRKEVWNRVVTMLLAARQYYSYWTDKWHASPYYATAHVIISLLQADEPLFSECIPSIEWLVHMQRHDGSWGYFDVSTVEETAYALLALLHYHRKFDTLDVEALKKGAAFLNRMGLGQSEDTYPDLWIAKALFAPKDVIKSAILAALLLYEDTFGRIPD